MVVFIQDWDMMMSFIIKIILLMNGFGNSFNEVNDKQKLPSEKEFFKLF